jgi:hypothetical protein
MMNMAATFRGLVSVPPADPLSNAAMFTEPV